MNCSTRLKRVDIFQPSVAFQIKSSHLICKANNMTGFYMKCETGMNWVLKNVTIYLLCFSVSSDSLVAHVLQSFFFAHYKRPMT